MGRISKKYFKIIKGIKENIKEGDRCLLFSENQTRMVYF
jgi:hypothetical protein